MNSTEANTELEPLATPPGAPPAEPPPKPANMLWLLAAAVLTVILWQLPWGEYILYPFTILATWFHEMGHGVTAMLLGGKFHKLMIYPNGSGVALHSGSFYLGHLGSALVAAGGPLGPPLAGAFFIMAGRRYNTAHYGLIVLGFMLLFSAVVWVRSPFGVVAVCLLGLSIWLLAFKTSHPVQNFAIQFLGVQACVSSYYQVDYLLTHSVVIDSKQMLSDTAQIAQHLVLPYWFWGGLVTALSLLILFLSLRYVYR